MKSFKFLSALLLSSGFFFSSCSKDNAPPQTCRIITISPSSGNGFNFTYNNSGKLETVTNGNSLTVFSYSGNIMVANTTTNGNLSTKKTVIFNANGFPASVKTETSPTGFIWYKDAYEYNGSELIKDTYTNSSNVAPQIGTVIWSGGNLTSITQSGGTSAIEYYTDKPSQDGDYFTITQLIQGYKLYNTKSSVKSILTNGNITSFDYTYDGGKIIAMKFNGNGTIVNYDYQYQCNK